MDLFMEKLNTRCCCHRPAPASGLKRYILVPFGIVVWYSFLRIKQRHTMKANTVVACAVAKILPFQTSIFSISHWLLVPFCRASLFIIRYLWSERARANIGQAWASSYVCHFCQYLPRQHGRRRKGSETICTLQIDSKYCSSVKRTPETWTFSRSVRKKKEFSPSCDFVQL